MLSLLPRQRKVSKSASKKGRTRLQVVPFPFAGRWTSRNLSVVHLERKDERGPGARFLAPEPSANPPVFQEELGDVKAVSAPAASPIRCETSRGTDRISVLPRCDSQPPGGAPVPGQRRRITRNISDPGRSEFHQRTDHRLTSTGAGRVQDDQVRPFSHQPVSQVVLRSARPAAFTFAGTFCTKSLCDVCDASTPKM